MPAIPTSVLMLDALFALPSGVVSHLLTIFAAFAGAAAPAAIMALWQGAAVALILALSLRLAPRVSAAHRFAIWTAAFAVVAALPFLPALAHSAAASIAQSAPIRSISVKPLFQLDSRWGLIVAGLWLVASAFRAADLAIHSMRLRRLLKSAVPVEVDPNLRALLAAASRSRRPIQICTTSRLDRPSVVGFLAPRILIPHWLFEKLTPGELEHIILHEAEHLRRRDDWTNLLQKLSLALFPLNPALVWMERRLCREREMACDEGVVRRTQAPRAYAACLTSLAERSLHRRAQALSLGVFGRRPELVHRVHSILWRKRMLHPIAARACVGIIGCGLLFASVEFARCPQVVAFVPHQSNSASDLANALPAQTNIASSGARMIETRAILSDRRRSVTSLVPALPRPNPPQSRATLQSERASLESTPGAPRQMPPFARSSVSGAASPAANMQDRLPQFIVLTAWEQVQTSPHRSRHFADYDSSADAASQNTAAAPNSSAASQDSTAATTASPAQTQTRITVTQLILRVYPAGSASPAPKHSRARDFIYAPPTAVPFDGGWLVFTL